jgi:methionyl-tRNA formyltransferase
VVTRPDKRRGRGGATTPSPVKAAATELGLTVVDTPDDVLAHRVALGVVVAYGRIIRPPLLGSVPLVNVHFSLLPRWRGAAPVERAILAGDAVTGVCVMGLEAGLDTGPVYRRAETPIGPDERVGPLRARLADLGRDLLVGALADGLGTPEPQIGEPTLAAKITPEELHLDWAQPADQLLRVVRLERAWTTWKGKRLLVLVAAPAPEESRGVPGTLTGDVVSTGEGAVRLVVVQPEGRAPLDAAAWVRGARPGPGARLGS